LLAYLLESTLPSWLCFSHAENFEADPPLCIDQKDEEKQPFHYKTSVS